MKKLSLLALPVLFALGCGGVDSLFGDGGIDGGPCAAGVTPYQIKTGTGYATSKVAAGPVEDCGLGLTAANLVGSTREVANSGQGIISIYSLGTSSKLLLGSGSINCNVGTLTSSGVKFTANGCDMTLTTTVAVTVTGPSQMDYAVDQNRSNFTQDPTPGAMACAYLKAPVKNSCKITYTATMVQ